jgi:cytochrome c-type biogenesis protein CcmH
MIPSVLIVLLLALPGSLAAQPVWTPAALDAEVRRVALELRCPRCQGLSIADSPDDLAVQMNVVIRQQLIEGRTPEEIQAYFVSRYGEWVLLRPEPKGFNLVAYLAPVLAMVVGAGILVSRVRKWTRPRSAAAASGAVGPPGAGGSG